MPSAFLRANGLRWSLLCATSFIAAIAAHAVPTGTATTLTITSGTPAAVATTVPSGTTVTLTATVLLGGNPVNDGQVAFCDASATFCADIHRLGTAQVTASGTAVLKFRPGIGTHAYKAVYLGVPNDRPAKQGSTSATQSLTVTAGAPTVALTSSGYLTNYGLSATVTASGTTTAPTGSVSFLDTSNSNYSLASAPLGSPTSSSAFGSAVTYATNPNPFSVAIGDFNGDGIPDLAFTNIEVANVSVRQGTGQGTFGPQATYTTGHSPFAVVAADFNNDGNLDLAITNSDDNTVSILLGNGDGTFAQQVTYATGAEPAYMVAADINGTGNISLVIANFNASSVSILLGYGDGGFEAQKVVSVGARPTGLATGDFNGDGLTDLAVVNSTNETLSVLFQGPGVNFTTPVTYPTGDSPATIAAADFNGDGVLDLAVANSRSSSAGVFLGNGDGTFKPQVAYATGSEPGAIVVGDFNGDGIADLATANDGPSTASLLLGNGDGTFKPQTQYSVATGPLGIAAADLNGDGYSDFVTTGSVFSNSSVVLSKVSATATASVSGISPLGPAQAHEIVASYSGDITFPTATSNQVSLTGYPDFTSVNLSISPAGGSTFGQQVAITASLSPYSAQGHSTDGESISFYGAGVFLGTATLTSGSATLNTTALPLGQDYIVAIYPYGDPYFNFSDGFIDNYTVASPLQTLSVTAANITVIAGATPSQTVAELLASYTAPGLTGTQLAAEFANAEVGFTVTGPGFSQNIPLFSYGTYYGANLLAQVPAGAPNGTFTLTPYLTGPGAANFTFTPTAGTLTIDPPGTQLLTVTAANITVTAGATPTQTVADLMASYSAPGLTGLQLEAEFANLEIGFTVSGPGFSQNIPLFSYGTYNGMNLLAQVPAGAPTGTFTLTPYITGSGAAGFAFNPVPGTLTIAPPQH